MQKTILLTGATGFLGSHLLGNFIKHGHKVIALVRSTSDLWRINEFLPECRTYEIDKIPIKNIFQESKIDLVVHTACSYGRKGESISSIIDSNLNFGLQILEAAVAYKVESFINTDTLLPKDINSYSLSKTQFGDWLKYLSKDIQVINLRMEHMYGPKDDKNKFVPWLISEMIQNKGVIKMTTGIQKRNFLFIDDVVAAFLLVIEKKELLKQYSDFDVATNKLLEVREFVLLIAQKLKIRNLINQQPIFDFGAIKYRTNEIMKPIYNNSDIYKLGWIPKVEAELGIKKILETL